MSKEIKKIVLAYSGGLDTSVIVPWLKENYHNPEIIGVCINVGQTPELVDIEERANIAGVDKLIVADVRQEFVYDFIFPMLKAGAKYEGYTLGTPIDQKIFFIVISRSGPWLRCLSLFSVTFFLIPTSLKKFFTSFNRLFWVSLSFPLKLFLLIVSHLALIFTACGMLGFLYSYCISLFV